MFNDPLAATLAKVMNAELVGKKEVVVRPASKIIKQVLRLMQDYNYIGSFEEVQDGQHIILKVNLLGNINKCGVVKPRFSAKYMGLEKWEKRYLPAKDFGIILLSTPQGIMTHAQAKQKQVGGVLLAFCY